MPSAAQAFYLAAFVMLGASNARSHTATKSKANSADTCYVGLLFRNGSGLEAYS